MKNVQPSKNASEGLSATQKGNKVLTSTVYPTKHPLASEKTYQPLREIKSIAYEDDLRKQKSKKNTVTLMIVILGIFIFFATLISFITLIINQQR